ncbi:MAG TPA: hypothetical protein VGQ53_13555 [Chitinophagaceae bacterium]|jgi:hypothetical protein|nr:hypothetical protein [Chitinophagaceae bacterium]
MSNENPTNAPHWRNKLDELEHLPGSAFNGDAAWDKLYGRLRGNKKSKKIFWYWGAAACLMFGLMITLLNQPKGSSQNENKETAIKQTKKIDKPDERIDNAMKNKNENNTEPINDKIVTTSGKSVQRNRRIIPTEVTSKVQSNNVVVNGPEQEPIAIPLQIVRNATTVAVPPKKKLNVVHINELGDPVIESSDVTRIEDIRSFKLKFGTGEVFSNSPVASKPSGFIILKTKTASN